MKKILLIPAIILLLCCVTVGAFNVVSGSDNRPMTFYESLVTISEIEFSFDEMSALLDSISELWSPGSSTYPHAGGSGGNSGGTFPGSPGTRFGEVNYAADTDHEWLNSILNVISKSYGTLVAIFKVFILVLKDAVTTVYTFFDIFSKFFFGVPA